MHTHEIKDLSELMTDGVYEGVISHTKDLPQYGLPADLWVIGVVQDNIAYSKAVYLAEGSEKPRFGDKVKVERLPDFDLPVVTVL